MTDCIKYRDAISAYVDGELTNAEQEELMQHIAQCEECARLLDEYKEVSALFAAEVEVPEDLAANVMTGVRKVKSAKMKKLFLTRALPIAACLVLAVGAVRFLPRMGSSAMNSAAMDTAASDSVAESEDSAALDGGINAYSEGSATDESMRNYNDTDDVVEEHTLADDAENIFPEAEIVSGYGAVLTVYGMADTFINGELPSDFPEEIRSADFVETGSYYTTGIPGSALDATLEALDALNAKYDYTVFDAEWDTVLVEILP